MTDPQERQVPSDARDVLRRMLPILRPFLRRFALGAGLILISTGVEIAMPVVIGKSVDAAVGAGRNLTHLYWICTGYLALIVGKAVLEAVEAYVIQSTGQAVTHELRARLFGKVLSLPVAYFDGTPTGRLVTRVINDIKSLSELFTASISVLPLDFMIILGTVAAMLWVHWKLALLVLVTFPGVLLIIHHFGGRLAIAYRQVRARLSEINAFLGENIGAIATIQRLGAEEERLRKFERIVEVHQAAQMASLRVFATVQPLANVLNGVSMGTLLAVGGLWVIQGKITIGVVVAFLAYLRNLFQPIRDLVEKYNTFLSATVAAERVVALLDEPTESGREGFAAERGDVSRLAQDGPLSIRFENVGFQYPNRHRRAIDGVTFEVPAGHSLAVVGATGSGKSTLIRLLLRFYEPDEGKILFGDRELGAWDRGELRRTVGVIHQDIYLFQGSLRENLTLGRNHLSDDYLVEQCRRAQLWGFAEKRGGLEMPVYEGGTNLSIGERQLISFARILVLNTPVLILDEATSSVDRWLEKRLMDAIRETLRGRTSVVIAHRLSTIRKCDSILVLDHGRIVEAGTHEALLRHEGVFAKFHEIHAGT